MIRKMAPPIAAAMPIFAPVDRLFLVGRGNCCGAGATLPAFASATNFIMSALTFSFALSRAADLVDDSFAFTPGSESGAEAANAIPLKHVISAPAITIEVIFFRGFMIFPFQARGRNSPEPDHEGAAPSANGPASQNTLRYAWRAVHPQLRATFATDEARQRYKEPQGSPPCGNRRGGCRMRFRACADRHTR